MRARSAAIITLCLILAVVWSSGVHVHLGHEHAVPAEGAGLEPADHDAHSGNLLIAETMSEGAPGHFDAHLHHGHVDLGSLAKAHSKPPVLKQPVMFVLLLAIALVLLLPALALRAPRPPLRPPAWQRRPYLLPPSHAPPLAA